MYSPIATEVHAASNLHHKHRPDKTLQYYIQNFTNLTEKAMKTDSANITNREIIFLFIKNLYNRDIRRWVAGTKTTNMLADTLRVSTSQPIKIEKV